MNLKSFDFDVNQLNVLVTGGSNGIGYQISKAFLMKNSNVVNWDINDSSKVVELNETYGDCYRFENVNVSDENSVQNAVKNLPEEIHVLINNAGIMLKAPVTDIKIEDWDKMYDINVKGCMLVTKHITPKMLDSKRGRIINISSMTAKIGLETYSMYSSTKAAVSNLTKVWALELANYGVTVNALCPGWVQTQMKYGLIDKISDLHNLSKDKAIEAILNYVPQHRYIQTEEIAFTCLFLASSLAQGISGHELSIDNGLTNSFAPGFHMKDLQNLKLK